MDKEELNKLIKELEELQIRQEAVIRKIRASTEEASSSADRSAPTAPEQGTREPSFTVGSKALIKNRLGHVPFGRRSSIKDRIGLVTKITKKRVHITTANGGETSRAPHNLRHLSSQEYEDIARNA